MSISATSNYMSNADILVWMENKTDGLYGQMRDAMDVANTRTDAESALDDVKALIGNCKNDGSDCKAIHDLVNEVIAKYPNVPEVSQALQPIADKLNALYGTSDPVNVPPADSTVTTAAPLNPNTTISINSNVTLHTPSTNTPANHQLPEVPLNGGDADSWIKQIGDKVDVLGKQDQLGLINIQEFNSQLNQTKQTASALMDAADKAASSIINHIG
jgi:hypothetical protein